MRFPSLLPIAFVLVPMMGVALAQPNFEKLMITEVSWGQPEGLEITNFASTTQALTGLVVVWNDGSSVTSSSLSGSLLPGRSVIVTEPAPGVLAEAPAGTLVFANLPSLSTSTQAFNVALRNAGGSVLDEVRISSTSGVNSLPGLGGTFRGLAMRGALALSVSVERTWGLDSDGGIDWSEETVRSFGLENRSSGPRGTDPTPVPQIYLTEIDDAPDFIEIYNAGSAPVGLNNWLILCTSGQGGLPTRITPFTGLAPQIASGSYHVFGDTATAPAELPVSVGYTNVAASGPGFPFGTSEFSLALYDHLGRVVDCIRTTGSGTTVVHNAPRAPTASLDFLGAVERQGNLGGGSIGRRIGAFGYFTSNQGSSWQPCFTRTMGSVNSDFTGVPGLGSILDVRFHESPLGDDLRMILNAGASSAGRFYSFFLSAGHQNSAGPFFGLGLDALLNWQIVLASPPFSGNLDNRGSARVDLAPSTLPPNLDLDLMFILQEPTGSLVSRTAILEFDT